VKTIDFFSIALPPLFNAKNNIHKYIMA